MSLMVSVSLSVFLDQGNFFGIREISGKNQGILYQMIGRNPVLVLGKNVYRYNGNIPKLPKKYLPTHVEESCVPTTFARFNC